MVAASKDKSSFVVHGSSSYSSPGLVIVWHHGGSFVIVAWVLMPLPLPFHSEGVIDTFVDHGAACDARIHG